VDGMEGDPLPGVAVPSRLGKPKLQA